ncbi:hypothetical protein [Aliivibrio salmonicida]|uniref:hypothetical protein n=1 Tax=Aliivibrio salmonicida TaxID=40269 RepID=UPI0013EA2A0D|nr:hypothetical protein [Aliivibrio salmonicida]
MKYIRVYLSFLFMFMFMVNPSAAIANSNILGLAIMSTQPGPETFRDTCAEQKFNAKNFYFSNNSILHEGSIGSEGQFTISNDQVLMMCGGDSVFGNEKKTKCVGPGAMFKRKWSKPVKLERGVNYSKALVLSRCKLIFIEDFKVSSE